MTLLEKNMMQILRFNLSFIISNVILIFKIVLSLSVSKKTERTEDA